MGQAGIDPDEVRYLNAMRCLPTDAPPSKAGINACQNRLAEEIIEHPRKVVLVLGNSAARSIFNDHNFKITGKRGQPIDLGELGVFMPTFHPASILRNQGEYPRWVEDIKYAARLYAGGRAAIKRPPKPTAHIMLLEPDEETYYDAVMELQPSGRVTQVDYDTTRPWDSSVIDGSQQHDWPKRKMYAGIPAAVRAVDYLLQMPVLAGDIETGHSYSPRLGEVIALSVAWSPTEAIVFSEGLLNSKGFRPHLARLLMAEGPLWVGHNFKYDGAYLRWFFLGGDWPETGVLSDPEAGTNPYHDTMLEHYCLDETKGTHDLESVSRDLLGAQDYKAIVKKYTRGSNKKKGQEADKGYENVPREILYPYAALDTTHTFSIHEILCPKLHKSKSLTRMYEHLLLPAARFLQRVQDAGLYVNQEFVASLDEEFTEIIDSNKEKLEVEVNQRQTNLFPLDRIPPGTDMSKPENSKKLAALNAKLGPTDFGPLWDTDLYMSSPWATKKRPEGYGAGNYRHTTFVLYRLLGWVPMNTNERTLRDLDQTGKDQSAVFGYKAKNYARGHPNRKQKLNYDFIQALIDVRLASHSYSMLVAGTRKNLEPDGRLHSTFNLQATETGRLSSTNPNLQNLPVPEPDDERPARNIVGSPPGRVLIEADYSQVELRLLAHFSSDANLIQVYKDGRDLHTELSIAIWGDVVLDANGKQIGGYTKYQRVRAKAVNFGIAYGRGAGSIAAEHDIPEAEAEEMRQAWFAQFPSAAQWLNELHQSPFLGRTVISPFGRRRRFGVVSRDNYHDLKNQSANFPMQSTASDLTLLSGMRIQRQWLASGLDAAVICLVHDALVVEASDETAEQASAELKKIMEDTPVRILQPAIDFPVEIHTGQSWGTLKFEEMAGHKAKSAHTGTFGRAGVASGKL